jgi:hypothetical protein
MMPLLLGETKEYYLKVQQQLQVWHRNRQENGRRDAGRRCPNRPAPLGRTESRPLPP